MSNRISFSIYLSIKALEAILRSRSYRGMILNRDVNIFLDASISELAAAVGNNPDETYIGDFLRYNSRGVKFHVANELVAQLLEDPERFSQDPFAVYILAISSADAKRIREQYGVLCFSDSTTLRLPPLRFQKNTFCEKDKVGKSWASFLRELSEIPLNTLAINDRYLLPSKENELECSMQNLEDIFAALLPSVDGRSPVHVFIYFDAVDKDWSLDFLHENSEETQFPDLQRLFQHSVKEEFQKKSRAIYDMVRSFAMNRYPVHTYCVSYFRGLDKNKKDGSLFMKTYVPGYERTHNRRILTDYIQISADYGLVAFSLSGQVLKTQALNAKGLFCEGLNDKSDIPEERHRMELSSLPGRDNADNVLFSKDGKLIEGTKQIMNEIGQIPLLADEQNKTGALLLEL